MHVLLLLSVLAAQPIVNEERVLSVAFSSDGKYLAAGGGAATVIWDLEKGKSVASLKQSGVYVTSFSPDGTILVTGGAGWEIRLWDGQTFKKHPVEVQDHHKGRPTTFGFSADSKRLFSTGADGSWIEWDLSNGKVLKRFKPDEKMARHFKAVGSPDGKYLLISTKRHDGVGKFSIGVWDTAAGTRVKHLDHEAYFTVPAFSPNSEYLAGTNFGADKKSQFSLREVATGKEIFADNDDGLATSAIVFSPTNTTVFYALSDGNVYGVDLKKRERGRTYKALSGTIEALAVSKDGTILAAGADKEIRLWNVKTGVEIPVPRK